MHHHLVPCTVDSINRSLARPGPPQGGGLDVLDSAFTELAGDLVADMQAAMDVSLDEMSLGFQVRPGVRARGQV
jgi:hypothetical protein